MDISIFPIISDTERKLPFFLYSVGVREHQEHVTRPSGYPAYHYLHCSSGKGKLIIYGKEFDINEGSGFFLYPGVPHEYYSLEEPWKTHWITFDGYAVKDLIETIIPKEWHVFYLTGKNILEKHLDNICKSTASGGHFNSHRTSILLYEFIILLKEHLSDGSKQVKPSMKSQLHMVIQFVENHYNRDISLEEMSAVIKVSPQHLCRLFKQTFQMRPFEYLTRYRLKKAKELLISPHNYPIKEICPLVGYNDTSYFCSTFKEYEGCTPLEFKRIYRSY